MPDYLLLESGDHLLTEAGDRVLLESSPAELTGSATITLTATATLQMGVLLTGSATITLTAIATLTVPGGGVITGTATITLTATADLTSLAPVLTGQARITFTAAAALANYPAIRPLRDATIQRPVGRVESIDGEAATPLPGVLRFSLESSLDTPSDGWTAEVAGAALMLAPDDEALYRLPIGFLDAADQAVLADHVTSGRILDRRLVGRADERRTYLRGVDALERTFRTQRRVRYVPEASAVDVLATRAQIYERALSARRAALETLQRDPAWPTPEMEARADLLAATIRTLEEDVPVAQAEAIEEKVGPWSAKTIAEDLLAGTGLALVWTARDYSMSVPFEATGELYALLQRLVEPWNQAPPLGVDVTALGATVHVRPRPLAPPADLTLTVAASRLTELELGDRRRLPYYGTVTLEGRVGDPPGAAFDPGDTTIFPPVGLIASSEVTVVSEEITPHGSVQSTRTYRMPDGVLLHEVEASLTFAGLLTARVETTNTYEDSRYGPGGALLNQPLPLSSHKTIETLVKRGGVLQIWPTAEEELTWAYDEGRFLAFTTTRISRWSDAPGFVGMLPVEIIEETYSRPLDGWVQVKTYRDTFDPKTGQFVQSETLHQQDRAGLPPGGPRPPFSLFGTRIGGDDDPVAHQPAHLVETISTDPTAIAVSYGNPNLAPPDLAFIMDQFRAASGLVEYPLRAQGPALPDVLKGSALHLTEYYDADGTPIPLDPAQVRSIRFAYQDTRERSEFTCAIDAVFYRTT
jgi:hypothetical protein